jgi:hypothetical protein
MAVFAENFQNYRKKIEPRRSKSSKTHCEAKFSARRRSIFRIAGSYDSHCTQPQSSCTIVDSPSPPAGRPSTPDVIPTMLYFQHLAHSLDRILLSMVTDELKSHSLGRMKVATLRLVACFFLECLLSQNLVLAFQLLDSLCRV